MNWYSHPPDNIRRYARPAGYRCLRPGRVQMEHSVTLVPANARRYFPAAAGQAALRVRQIRRVLRSVIHDESEGSAALLLSEGLAYHFPRPPRNSVLDNGRHSAASGCRLCERGAAGQVFAAQASVNRAASGGRTPRRRSQQPPATFRRRRPTAFGQADVRAVPQPSQHRQQAG